MRTVLLFVALSAAMARYALAAAVSPEPQAIDVPAMHFDESQLTKGAAQKAAQPAPAAAASVGAAGCPPPDALFLPTGFVFWAKLPQAIFSYNTAVPVMAQIDADVKFLDRLVLPKGTNLVGSVTTLHSDDRVNINWQLVVMPRGCEFPISAVALDKSDGAAGVKGDVVKHEDSVAAHIALKSALAATGSAAIAATPGGSLESALASNFSTEAGQNVDKDLANVKSLESIYVHANSDIRVFVLRRFIRPAEGR